MLTDLGHNVVSGAEINPRATDEALLAVANQEQRVLVTEDKDFGELVFVRHLPHPCIIRFVEMQVSEKVAAMRELLEQHADADARERYDRGDAETGADTSRKTQRAGYQLRTVSAREPSKIDADWCFERD